MGCHYHPQKPELEEKDQSAFFFLAEDEYSCFYTKITTTE